MTDQNHEPQVCMIFRTAKASQHGDTFQPTRSEHKVSCAGCSCPEGTVCDTRLRCHYCGHSKTACDAYRSRDDGSQCCKRCDHRAI